MSITTSVRQIEPSPIADILAHAALLVLDGWTQGEYARNKAGDGVWFTDPGAICWCARGAIQKVRLDTPDWHLIEQSPVGICERLLGDDTSLALWNDAPGRTAEEVADLLLRAAEAAGSNG